MPLVFVAHVATVVVPVTDPGCSDAPAVIAAKLVCVAGSDQRGCRDKSCLQLNPSNNFDFLQNFLFFFVPPQAIQLISKAVEELSK